MARKLFKLRLSDDEKARIAQQAQAAGFDSVGAYVRWRSLQPDFGTALHTVRKLLELGLCDAALDVAKSEWTNPRSASDR